MKVATSEKKEKILSLVEEAKQKGASYCDVRHETICEEWLEVKNGALTEKIFRTSSGFAIRVLFDGVWGFASTSREDMPSLRKALKKALSLARSLSFSSRKIELVPEPPHVDEWHTPFVIHPFSVSLEDKLAYLFKVDGILRSASEIAVSRVSMHFREVEKVFANSEGSWIEQTILHSGGGMQAIAVGKGDVQVRSYPMSFRGQFKSGGYEIFLSLALLENARRIRDEAIQLLTAAQCPRKKTSLILGKGQLVLQIHESVGHANELDRVLGWEKDFAGGSFNQLSHRGSFQYASPIVNFVADSTVPTGLATFGYDDEGVPAKRFYVVKDGVFLNYFTTRDTAGYIGESCSNGCARADGWKNVPITRIPNLSLMPGDMELEEIIATTEEGIWMDCNRCWSIDQWRLNFQFGCEIGWEIKNGKILRMVKNPTYTGVTPEFWRSCDAIASPRHWDLIGVINCGKGQPLQIARMSHGSSPARFRGVEVGV